MSGQCDLSRLDNNLCQIAERGTAHLVADPSDSSLASSWTVHGRLWTWYYGSLEFVCSLHNVEEEKFLATLHNIKKEFEEAIHYFETLSTRYRSKLLQNPDLEKTLPSEEQEIVGIGRKCSFLFQREALFSPHTVLLAVQQFFTQKIHTPLVSDEQFKTLSLFTRDYAIASIAGLLQMHFPTNCFMKLCDDEPLTASDRETLNSWVACVEENKHRLNVWLLHLALTGLVELFYKDLRKENGTLADTVGMLEWRLLQGGLHFLNFPDPKHLEWISTLKPNETKISIEGRVLCLGQKKNSSALDARNGALFELYDDPEHQLLVLANPALLGMWQAVCKTCAKDLKPVEIIAKDPFLRFCVVERVDKPVADVQWISRYGTVQSEDRPYLDTLANFLQWLSSSSHLPKSLPCASIFFKKEQNRMALRAILPLEEQERHDYLKLETFALEAAKSNQLIFRYLMHESQLVEHPVACFFRDMVKKRIVGPEDVLSIKDEAILAHITDPEIAKRAEALVASMRAIVRPMQERLALKVKKASLLPKLHEIISGHFAKLFKELGYAAQVPPLFLDSQAMKEIEKEIETHISNRL